MKTLFIIRHGKAEPRGNYPSDTDRPLTDDGAENHRCAEDYQEGGGARDHCG